MSKILKVKASCPRCKSSLVIEVKECDLGKDKQGICRRCHSSYSFSIPMSYASRFESDPTIGGNEADLSLILEIVPNDLTSYQCFELTSEYYTIGRKNSSGPEYRPDVEVETTDKKMSRKHAAIRKKGKMGFTLMDLGSKNGVFHNGNKMDTDEELYLSDGDTFRIGETLFRVNITEQRLDKENLAI